MTRFIPLALAILAGCSMFTDLDGDGVLNEDDCNPNMADGMSISACDCPDQNPDCPQEPTDTGTTPDDTGIEQLETWCYDYDGDGFGDPADCQTYESEHYVLDATDCDDFNSAINPAAIEFCNLVDDDCDGDVDEDVMSKFYADLDADGYGGTLQTIMACEAPTGYTSDATDCNDADPGMSPGEAEYCDGRDNDCNGEIDDDYAIDAPIWYTDIDMDGYGNAEFARSACSQPSGFVADASDCDDLDDLVNPASAEFCDGVDQNCDGVIDEGVMDVFYADTDGDDYGDAISSVSACDQPTGYVTDASDCDDANAATNPAATESCNELDDDCDGTVDEDVTSRFYADTDGDGYGECLEDTSACTSVLACDAPAGYVSTTGDCDDSEATTFPGAPEYCDGIDNDCDGLSDEDDALDASTWYQDRDEDGYGDGASVMVTCYEPSGYVALDGDCNDLDADFNPGITEDDCTDPNDYNCDGSVGYADLDGDGFAACEECNDSDSAAFPGSTEFCNGLDDDCDGEIDDGSVDAPTWYYDGDIDGYGNAAYSIDACEVPMGYVPDSTDCDDSLATVNPAATEYCNGHDDDCDSDVDEDDAADAPTWYSDADSDTYGNAAVSTVTCYQPSGYVADDSDCLDTDDSVYPGATEYCDGADNDCDGVVDNGVTTATWYADADLDGYGDDATAITSCLIMSGYVLVGSDCDDADADVNPDVMEICDGTDEDCDGVVDNDCIYEDSDGDGYSTVLDCDDSDSAVNPAGTEICSDGLDNDCDGFDLDCDDVDWDGDGFSVNVGDCDDEDADIFPGAAENCTDGFDNDCDGVVDYLDSDCSAFVDDDGDGYAGADCDDSDPDISPAATEIPYNGIDEDCDGSDLTDVDADGYDYEIDCDETNPDVHPGATEVCGDGLDNDCDGEDFECAPTDGDGDGWLEADGDCDDADASTYPGASEICYDAADNDCNGLTDDGCPAWDMDGDGYSSISDCDDSDATVYPGATEAANGIDDDCDGVVDEGTDAYDDDGDGFSEADGDCDDADAMIYPGADEFCDGIDSDCDGTVDEAAALDADIWFADEDKDGFGDELSLAYSCTEPAGYTADGSDCDDNDSSVHPYATEYCNGADDDCDGDVDEDLATAIWYADLDLDGYGDDSTAFTSCLYEAGMVLVGGDCNDSDASVHPWADDVCEDDIDQDCDGADEACPVPPIEPEGTDADGDGVTVEDGDCDDSDVLVNPLATEACESGVDEDCDGEIDEMVCVSNVDCSLDTDGVTLVVTVSGNISGSLRMPLAGVITTVGLEGYTSGGRFTVAYQGDWLSHTLLVYSDTRFMVYAMDAAGTIQYASPEMWGTSGLCSRVEDGLGGWVFVSSSGT